MQESKSVISQNAKMTVEEALKFCSSTTIIEIKNNDQAEASARIFREVNTYIKKLETMREAEKAPYFQAGKAIDEHFKKAKSPLENLKTALGLAMGKYDKMLEDKRKEEQRKLDEKAAEEKRKAEEQARIQRDKEEAARRAEEEARQRAQAATNEAERRKAMAEAEKAKAAAEKAAERAEVKETKADTTIAAVAQVAAPVMQGIGTRTSMVCEITNPMLFVKFCIDNNITTLLMPNESAAGAWAKSQGIEQVYPWGRTFKKVTTTGRAI